jgi:hypothetical protein
LHLLSAEPAHLIYHLLIFDRLIYRKEDAMSNEVKTETRQSSTQWLSLDSWAVLLALAAAALVKLHILNTVKW